MAPLRDYTDEELLEQLRYSDENSFDTKTLGMICEAEINAILPEMKHEGFIKVIHQIADLNNPIRKFLRWCIERGCTKRAEFLHLTKEEKKQAEEMLKSLGLPTRRAQVTEKFNLHEQVAKEHQRIIEMTQMCLEVKKDRSIMQNRLNNMFPPSKIDLNK